MRAVLYQTKKGLPVFFGSLRSRNSTTLAEISSSTVLKRSSVSGTSSLQVWFFFAPGHGARRRQAAGGLGIDGPRHFRDAGDWRVFAGRRNALDIRVFVDVGEAHLLHGMEVIEVAQILLKAMRRRQRRGVVAQVVLAELAGGVAQIDQELGERRGPGRR
jgi:hypothetical protein